MRPQRVKRIRIELGAPSPRCGCAEFGLNCTFSVIHSKSHPRVTGWMTDILELPDGVRLARLEEIPGPDTDRSPVWARLRNARIAPGFTFVQSPPGERFRGYAEINVNASEIWAVFHALCSALLGSDVSLIAGDMDDEPVPIVSGDTSMILNALERHRYQLAHDGFLQFGLLYDQGDELAEVFVTPTKHFKVWLNDENRFRSLMYDHGLPQRETMEFVDEYPRVTTRLSEDRGVLLHGEEFWKHLSNLIDGTKMH